VKPCSQLINKKPYAKIFSDRTFGPLVPKLFSCIEVPETQRIKIFGDMFDPEMSTLKLNAYPCSQTDPTKCLDTAVFKEVAISLLYYKKIIIYSNFETPIHMERITKENMGMMDTTAATYTQNLGSVEVLNELSYFVPDKTKDKYLVQIENEDINFSARSPHSYCTPQQIDSGHCSQYFSMEYRSSGMVTTYIRTYADFITSMSEVGGIKEVIFGLASLVYFLYNKISRTLYITDKLINVGYLKSLFADQIGGPASAEGKIGLGLLSSNKVLIQYQTNVRNSLSLAEQSARKKETVCTGEKLQSKQSRNLARSLKDLIHIRKIRLEVDQMVEENSDILTLVKEINTIKVLKEILLKPYHLRLLPLVSIEMRRKSVKFYDDLKEARRGKLQEEGLKSAGTLQTFLHETLDYSQALNQLMAARSKQTSNQAAEGVGEQPILQEVHSSLDQFFCSNLPDFVRNKIESSMQVEDQRKNLPMASHPEALHSARRDEVQVSQETIQKEAFELHTPEVADEKKSLVGISGFSSPSRRHSLHSSLKRNQHSATKFMEVFPADKADA
jgi:hypothetical protein